MKLKPDSLFTDEEMKPLIRSISYSQDTILESIIYLHIPAGKIEVDPCYNKGGFYKSGEIVAPEKISDIDPIHGVPVHDCRNLLYGNNSVESILFDPPFLTYPGKNMCKLKSFGTFRNKKELFEMYEDSFQEFYRILQKDGILIVKCQDGTYGPDFSLLHVDAVLLPCRLIGFKEIDLFILLSKGRPERRDCIQRHARKYHCYFLVFRKG